MWPTALQAAQCGRYCRYDTGVVVRTVGSKFVGLWGANPNCGCHRVEFVLPCLKKKIFFLFRFVGVGISWCLQCLQWGIDYCRTRNLCILGVYSRRMSVLEKLGLGIWSTQSWGLWSLYNQSWFDYCPYLRETCSEWNSMKHLMQQWEGLGFGSFTPWEMAQGSLAGIMMGKGGSFRVSFSVRQLSWSRIESPAVLI